ncbi:unnamed protein product, partial [Closterium sp. NIES-54]
VAALKGEYLVRRAYLRAARQECRAAVGRAARQQREKQKQPSSAVAVIWTIDRAAWSLLSDGHVFAEAEIQHMLLNVDRDFNDIGMACFVIKSIAVRNCLPQAKSRLVLSAWNPPPDWSRSVPALPITPSHSPSPPLTAPTFLSCS